MIFTKGLKSFKDLEDKLRMFIYLPKWGLYLEDEEVKGDFEQLLEHRCFYCVKEDRRSLEGEQNVTFSTFRELKTHVQRTHDLFSCDLCSEHIKVRTKTKKVVDYLKI